MGGTGEPSGLSRRALLQGLGATVSAGALGCGDGAPALGPDGGAPPPDGAAPLPDAAQPPADARVLQPRCADDGPPPTERLMQIDTIVVLCMENRSFDHYFGSLRMSEGRADVDGLTGGEHNPRAAGDPVHVFRLEDYTPDDPPHGWDACHEQWNGGANDGFVRAHAGASEHQVMGFHERDQLPWLYALADQSALLDRMFCSLLGPTWPNRYYLHGGTSLGVKTNLPALGFRSIFHELDDAGVPAVNYFHDVAWATGAYAKLTGLRRIEQFFDDAAAGALPAFSLIDPGFFGAGANDDHPSHDVRLGQALIASVVAALGQSPQWERSLFVLTYDEHGGFYDHVAPPTVVDEREDFRQLGFRVPSVVASPFVRRGCTVRTQLEHCSLLSTLAARHGLPALNERVHASANFGVCLDADTFAAPHPPPELPPVEVSLSAVRARPDDPHRHHELAAAADRLHLPLTLDRRRESLAIAERVLDRGHRLGAVKLQR